MLKIAIALVAAIAILLIYASTKPSSFSYSRSGLINSTPENIFPYISQLNLGGQWSPYEKRDPKMQKEITGTDGAPGAKMTFDGNKDVGAGSIEILSLVPNERVNMRLLMTKPMNADNQIRYELKREGDQTRFTWNMSGDGGFFQKIFSVFVDCEKMIGKDFEEGIQNLKKVVESKP